MKEQRHHMMGILECLPRHGKADLRLLKACAERWRITGSECQGWLS
jgi:hypothetical protein